MASSVARTIIDVSEWQGKIDWERVKPHIDGAILRMGYAEDKAKYDDKHWKRNVSECERLGIPWGAYLYSYAKTQADLTGEVAHALRLLHGTSPQLPVYFDSEEKGTQKVAAGYAHQFCAAMRSAGYANGVYCSLNWWREHMSGKVDPDNLWIAAYGPNDGRAHARPSVGEEMWQYTSKGRVDGINGDVDMSYLYEEPKGVRMTKLSKAEIIAQVAEHFASHDAHGYSQPNRGKGGTETIRLSDGRTGIISSGDVDCSEMVRQCVNVALSGKHSSPIDYMWTGNEDYELTGHGFTRYSYDKAKVRRGDVLWVKGHTGVALGNGMQADAHGDERGGITGPKAGDQTGHEVEVRDLRSWTYLYRYSGSDEWIKQDGRWWYRHADGSYTTNGWERIDGKWYYFDKDGWMVSDQWVKWKGKWCYCEPSGACAYSKCLCIKGKWYAFGSDGYMVEGSVKLEDSGAMKL